MALDDDIAIISNIENIPGKLLYLQKMTFKQLSLQGPLSGQGFGKIQDTRYKKFIDKIGRSHYMSGGQKHDIHTFNTQAEVSPFTHRRVVFYVN